MENYHVIQYTGSALQFYGDMNLHECHGWISFHLLHKCVSAIPKLQAGIVPGFSENYRRIICNSKVQYAGNLYLSFAFW